MSFQKFIVSFNLLFLFTSLHSQNTVGVISHNTADTFNALTLFTSQTETYLINNCGEVINQWTSNYPPGNAVYLLEDGTLLRAGKIGNTDIVFGGTGGIVEKFDWEGNLIWSYEVSSETRVQHHDVFPMPNGNVLILVATVMSNAEAIQAGRNPALLTESVLYNEQIIEVEPTGLNQGNIVWEWNIKDHLIQDFDSSKDNFGNVAENPQLLDINFLSGRSGLANWLHINSIQYNEDLDQLILNSRNLNEFYIIDHSTSTAEASSNSGGIYGQGGDFLYRWGNPQSYRRGSESDQLLFGQHYPHFIPQGLPNEGQIILFNNGLGRSPSFSEVFILEPPTTSPGFYASPTTTGYEPVVSDYIFTKPNPEDLFSRILSSAQMLPNGNILICDGDSGYFIEIDDNENVVWSYINPTGSAGIMSQGDNPEDTPNVTFRAIKYGLDYPAFNGRDLTPGAPIEMNSDLNAACNLLNTQEFSLGQLSIFPNPVKDVLTIRSENSIDAIKIYNNLGALILESNYIENLPVSNLKNGLYFIELSSGSKKVTKKIVKN